MIILKVTKYIFEKTAREKGVILTPLPAFLGLFHMVSTKNDSI